MCSSDLKDMQEIGHMTFNVELVANTFAERYPEFVSAYIGVVDRAVAMYREDPTPFYEVVGESLGVGTDEAEYEMKGCDFLSAADQFCPAYMGDGTSDGDVVRVFQDCAEFLATQQCLLEVPEYEVFADAVDSSFIQSYLERGA